MSRPVSISTSGASVSGVVPLCYFISPFSVSVNTVVTGSVVYTLQYTSDNPQASTFDPTTANWKSHPLMTSSTVSDFVEFTTPVTAVRLNQASGGGSIAAKVIQAGL